MTSPAHENKNRSLLAQGTPEELMFALGNSVQLVGSSHPGMVIRDFNLRMGYQCVWFDINDHVTSGWFRGWELEPRGASPAQKKKED